MSVVTAPPSSAATGSTRVARTIANDVIDSAEAVFANPHGRRFGTAVRSFVGVIAQVTDTPPMEWSHGTLAALRHLSEQVVRAIEARLEDAHDPARAQRGMTAGMDEIRRVLDEVDLWQRQTLRTPSP